MIEQRQMGSVLCGKPGELLWVAIDGPSAAGKSTVAGLVAKKMSIGYLDTGAMYRAAAWYSLRQSTVPSEQAVQRMMEQVHFSLQGTELYLNGSPLNPSVRTLEVARLASRIALVPAVRAWLVHVQRSIAAKQSLVMDGRDIGTTVLPEAQVKIFLTASLAERARRRHSELGGAASYDGVQQAIQVRDVTDATRAVSPLRPAEDALVLDTTDRTVEALAEEIAVLCARVIGKEN